MADIKFNDFSFEVIGALEKLAQNTLEEVAGELESQIKKNSPVSKVKNDGSGLKNSWKHYVRKSGDGYTATIGSPLERALWVEFGTGEYALHGNGRKGGWFIPVGSGKGYISEAVAEAYGFTIRKGKGGKKWVYTQGMKPQRPVYKAYTSLKNKLIRHMQNRFKGGLS